MNLEADDDVLPLIDDGLSAGPPLRPAAATPQAAGGGGGGGGGGAVQPRAAQLPRASLIQPGSLAANLPPDPAAE